MQEVRCHTSIAGQGVGEVGHAYEAHLADLVPKQAPSHCHKKPIQRIMEQPLGHLTDAAHSDSVFVLFVALEDLGCPVRDQGDIVVNKGDDVAAGGLGAPILRGGRSSPLAIVYLHDLKLAIALEGIYRLLHLLRELTINDDDHFKGSHCLPLQRFQAGGEAPGPIVGRDYGGNPGPLSHRCLASFLSPYAGLTAALHGSVTIRNLTAPQGRHYISPCLPTTRSHPPARAWGTKSASPHSMRFRMRSQDHSGITPRSEWRARAT